MVVIDRPDRVVWDNLAQTNVGIFGNDHRMIGGAWRCCYESAQYGVQRAPWQSRRGIGAYLAGCCSAARSRSFDVMQPNQDGKVLSANAGRSVLRCQGAALAA